VASKFFQVVEAFASTIAFQQGQSLVRMPGSSHHAGWIAKGVKGVPDVRIHWKRAALSLDEPPPKLVCVALGGDFGDVDQPGGQKVGASRVDTFAVRRFSIQCYAWGADDGQAEDLYENALRAFHHLVSDGEQPGKDVRFSDEVWEDQLPNAGGEATRGTLISFTAMFELTVQDPPSQLTIVEVIDNSLFQERAPDDPRPKEIIHVTIT